VLSWARHVGRARDLRAMRYELVLYHRDKHTGDHIVTIDGREQRFRTRAAAMAAARAALERRANERDSVDATA